MARATVGGADGVSVALTRHGQLTTVATSDEVIAQMDRDQYATGEGPCMSAAEDGRSFHVESVDEEVRWPRFIPRARHHGIASILSSPLMVAERPVGSLNIYSNAERAFGLHDQELAALFASEASAILAEADVETSVGSVAKRLRDSLSAREMIAQAQGVVMARQGISAEAAYAILRQSSKKSGTTVRECAAALVDSTTRSDLIGQVGT
jgi:GAF domain-containing protein